MNNIHHTNPQYFIGIMSGTSMDGADAVLIQMRHQQWQGLIAHFFVPYSNELRQRLLSLQHSQHNELHLSHILANELAQQYAHAVHGLLQRAQIPPQNITAIGCHGQTIRHAPEHGYSIQLVNLALLAQRTQILTIGDFRSGDLAAGGQGAPLVPAFHHAIFAHPEHNRIVLNIGGIANISQLSPHHPPYGFDTGPGNMLLDAWAQHHFHQAYDRNGHIAQQGKILPHLRQSLNQHPYFRQRPPKSTGRELFSLQWLNTQLNGTENPYDVMRTLAQFTADTIITAIKTPPHDLFVCGGGVKNPLIMHALCEHFHAHGTNVHTTAALNLDPQHVEAAAFAWLAHCWIHCRPSNPTHATGAQRPVILGAAYHG